MIKKISLIVLFIGVVLCSPKVVHVYVTLADSGQGIISSNESLEYGTDLYNNQYWGALYGVKQFFERSSNWELIDDDVFTPNLVLERLVFRHKSHGAYLIADAYSGSYNQLRATNDVFRSLSGWHNNIIVVDDPNRDEVELGIHGYSDLIVYIGHHFFGYDEFIDNHNNQDDITRDVILLACVTNKMCPSIKKAKANPIILTEQFMAPEAYTLENVLEGWIIGEDKDSLELRAAKAYSKYQGCSISAALGVFTNSCQ